MGFVGNIIEPVMKAALSEEGPEYVFVVSFFGRFFCQSANLKVPDKEPFIHKGGMLMRSQVYLLYSFKGS